VSFLHTVRRDGNSRTEEIWLKIPRVLLDIFTGNKMFVSPAPRFLLSRGSCSGLFIAGLFVSPSSLARPGVVPDHGDEDQDAEERVNKPTEERCRRIQRRPRRWSTYLGRKFTPRYPGVDQFRVAVQIRKHRQPGCRHQRGDHRVKHHRCALVRKVAGLKGSRQYARRERHQRRRAEDAEIDPVQLQVDVQIRWKRP
jgi:hypothetical protein